MKVMTITQSLWKLEAQHFAKFSKFSKNSQIPIVMLQNLTFKGAAGVRTKTDIVLNGRGTALWMDMDLG